MSDTTPNLSISLLGPFAASLNQRSLTPFRTKSVQALLIYLVCEADHSHRREALMALLWPGLPLKSAQANMRQTLYRLRKLIPEVKGGDSAAAVPFLLADRQTIQINPDANVTLDVDSFANSDPAQAIDLYRGDFLSDFYLPDSEAFEAWASGRRAGYRRQVLALLEGETAAHIEQASHDEATQLAQRQLAIDNLRESGHRQLMEAWARSGRRQEALAHYDRLKQLLEKELGIEPEPETASLIKAIRAGELSKTTSGAAQQPVWLDERERPKHNLPQRLTSFIGRKEEIAAVAQLVSQNRLVMLTGIGGIGKTNLSLQVGRQLLDAFAGGVWLVELAPIGDPALVPDAVAHALGLRAISDRPILEVLLDFLKEKRCLLILDNCEHLIDATARFVTTVLQACREVKILASSREALAVPGEIPYRVPSLSVPSGQRPLSLAAWSQYDALRLFVERASTGLPDFRVTQDNIAPLAQICRRLDGIPLALELAAARAKVLTIAQIGERLDDRFRLLTGGSRTALPRQQTLRATVDWSWELLAESEQHLLGRLSVFAGGMRLEAVEVVCAGDGLESYGLLDGLSELVNKSLVITQREQGQATRYHLLETVRQYAQERLLATGSGGEYRRRHLDYYLELGEQAGEALFGPEQVAWMNRMEEEVDNMRAALSWAREMGSEAGLRLSTALWKFWEARGYAREGDAWISEMLALSGDKDLRLRAKAVGVQADFNMLLLNHDLAVAKAEECLAIYRELGDRKGIAFGLIRLAGTYFVANRPEGLQDENDYGVRLLLESLSIYRSLGDQLGQAESLQTLGYLEVSKNYVQAHRYYEESLSIFRQAGHLAGSGSVLGGLGRLAVWQKDYVAARAYLEEALAQKRLLGASGVFTIIELGHLSFRLGDYEQAQSYFQEGIALSRQTGEKWGEVWCLVRLGYVYLGMGEMIEARNHFVASQQMFAEAGDVIGVVFALEGMASLAARLKQPERAVRLIAWADATRERIQDSRPAFEQEDVDRDIGAIREMIDEDAYAAAYAEGRAMTMEQAVAIAFEDETSFSSAQQ